MVSTIFYFHPDPKIGEDEPILTSIFFQMAMKAPTSERIDFGKQHLKVFSRVSVEFYHLAGTVIWMPEINRMGESGFSTCFFSWGCCFGGICLFRLLV